jgi:hypothetical protein
MKTKGDRFANLIGVVAALSWLFCGPASGTSLSSLGVHFKSQPSDPNAYQNDTKLRPAVAKVLADAAALHNDEKYDNELKILEGAKDDPSNSSYDVYKIDDALIGAAIGAEDYNKALSAIEANTASAELSASDGPKLYPLAMTLNAKQDHNWRAIQYGEMMARTHLLSGEYARELARIYYLTEDYSDAERVAQEALAGDINEDEREKLQDVLEDSQKEQGTRQPGAGHQLALSLLGAFASGLQEGMGQQSNITYDPNKEMAERQESSMRATAKVQQAAAAELLTADPAFEAPVYRDLIKRRQQVTKKSEAAALNTFATGFAAMQKQAYAKAEPEFRAGLDIDPGNSQANYFYSNCLAQRGAILPVIDYLSRAMLFATNDEEKRQAQDTLRAYANPQSTDN